MFLILCFLTLATSQDVCTFILDGYSCTGPVVVNQSFCTCGVCELEQNGVQSYKCFCESNFYRFFQNSTDCTGSSADYSFPVCHNGTNLSTWHNWCDGVAPPIPSPNPAPSPSPLPVPAPLTPAPGFGPYSSDICYFTFTGYSCNGPILTVDPFCNCSACVKQGAFSYKCFCESYFYRYYVGAPNCTGSYADHPYPSCHNGTGLSTWYNWCNGVPPSPAPRPAPAPKPFPAPKPAPAPKPLPAPAPAPAPKGKKP